MGLTWPCNGFFVEMKLMLYIEYLKETISQYNKPFLSGNVGMGPNIWHIELDFLSCNYQIKYLGFFSSIFHVNEKICF